MVVELRAAEAATVVRQDGWQSKRYPKRYETPEEVEGPWEGTGPLGWQVVAPEPGLSLDPKEGERKVREPGWRPQGLSRRSPTDGRKGRDQGQPAEATRVCGPPGVT